MKTNLVLSLRNLCVLCVSAVSLSASYYSPQRRRGRRGYAEIKPLLLVLCFVTIGSFSLELHAQTPSSFDILHYNIRIEPDIPRKSLKGSVTVRFAANVQNLSTIELNCGDLEIEAVAQRGVAREFSVKDHRLTVKLDPMRAGQTAELAINYHGKPTYGISFFPEQSQVYTVFWTSQWTVCIDAPDDKATLNLTLVVPQQLTAIANGQLVSTRKVAGKTVTEWQQRSPIPTYVFGFAVGPFRTVTEKRANVQFQYFVTGFSETETRRIFRETPAILEFFEDRAGVKYADKTYTQVLAKGNVGQEMSSFTAIYENYGKKVLADEQDVSLSAHEFAHQWWGNMVTCRNWGHFWLNEGIANFMAAAYLEHRFGRSLYQREIENSRVEYEKVRAAGKDKSLVFPDWLNPTAEDRILVYDKGAYVIHLLREEMGEQAFWSGLRSYTRKYFGKSVVTSDFETAMEEANGKSLDQFFAKWVYMK